MLKGKGLGVSKEAQEHVRKHITAESNWAKQMQKRRGELWQEVELNERTGNLIDRVFTANKVGEMSPFITFTMLDDTVGLICATVFRAKFYKGDGTEFKRNDIGYITYKKPSDTLRKELPGSGWDYSSRLDHSYIEQGTHDILESVVVRFEEPGYFWLPKTELAFQVKSDILFDVTPHTSTRLSFRIYLFKASYSIFTDLRAKGMLPLPEGLGDPALGMLVHREGEIDRREDAKRDYRNR